MFKVESIALTAALFGYATAATGCYPAYTSAGGYTDDEKSFSSYASATETVDVISDCTITDPATAGCVNGKRTTTTTKTYNYKCWEPLFCNKVGHGPTELGGSVAWNKVGECSGTVTVSAGSATIPLPDLYNGASGSGCPKAFVAGTDYDAGDIVSVVKSAYTSVYQCAGEPTNQFCGMAGYEAGEGLYWEQAWTDLGRCAGTISPTDSPVFVSLADAGGCPKEYENSGDDYEEGDRVSKDGYVYTCKGWPNSAHCSQAGYEPGNDIPTAEDPYWKQAWSVTGFCSGTIAPTSSPSNEVLTFMGGCPEVWDGSTYEEGDKVSDGQLVFQCKAWPHSGHCGQAGYEPNTDPATPEAWKDAWTVVGYCRGSVGPTSSPSVDAANLVGVCPEEWESGDNLKYEEGDMVSATVSDVPLRKIAFKCKAWPYSGHCGQHAPTEELGGSLGWTIAGSCDGSVGPTSSPSFDKLNEVVGGCPDLYSKTYTDYEAGDLVSYQTSATPSRTLLYECRSFPNSGYCNQAGFEPTTQYSNMAWTLKGYCDGSMAPTPAPQPYAGTCLYTKCVDDTVCDKDGIAPPVNNPALSPPTDGGVNGGTACSCTSNSDPDCTKGTQTICRFKNVDSYSTSTTYAFGDEVRLGATRFKCKNWPNGLWCNNAAYKPELEAGIWGDAWSKESDCP